MWLLDVTMPDAVLNAVGLIKQLSKGQSPLAAIRLNALLPHELGNAFGRGAHLAARSGLDHRSLSLHETDDILKDLI